MKYVIVFLFALLFVAFVAAADEQCTCPCPCGSASAGGAAGGATGSKNPVNGFGDFVLGVLDFAAKHPDIDI